MSQLFGKHSLEWVVQKMICNLFKRAIVSFVWSFPIAFHVAAFILFTVPRYTNVYDTFLPGYDVWIRALVYVTFIIVSKTKKNKKKKKHKRVVAVYIYIAYHNRENSNKYFYACNWTSI